MTNVQAIPDTETTESTEAATDAAFVSGMTEDALAQPIHLGFFQHLHMLFASLHHRREAHGTILPQDDKSIQQTIQPPI
jgi:hypothetical protein